jgi:hypothetical protein
MQRTSESNLPRSTALQRLAGVLVTRLVGKVIADA